VYSVLLTRKDARNLFERVFINALDLIAEVLSTLIVIVMSIVGLVVIFSYRIPLSGFRIMSGWIKRKKSHLE